MAKITSHKSIFFNLVSYSSLSSWSLWLRAELLEVRVAMTNIGQVCNKVVGVKSGDTCFAIAQQSQLTSESFSSINPNLNCDALFVGQWLCISGKST
ncbi:hypothetical protein NL676_032950 [Syzygium grande]|nr:hypothetical protein NL676_032950 [Syzygium grande]